MKSVVICTHVNADRYTQTHMSTLVHFLTFLCCTLGHTAPCRAVLFLSFFLLCKEPLGQNLIFYQADSQGKEFPLLSALF